MKLYILGGRPCSGKTTFAYKIGMQYNLPVMHLDIFAHETIQKATKDTPELHKWKTDDMLDILQDNPTRLHIDYEKFYDELFPIFLGFLKKYDKDALVIESALLLPKFVKVLEKHYDVETVYLFASNSFVRDRYQKRDYAIEMMKTYKGQTALHNLLQRDILFSTRLYKDVLSQGYSIVEVKKTDDIQAYNSVLQHFELD